MIYVRDLGAHRLTSLVKSPQGNPLLDSTVAFNPLGEPNRAIPPAQYSSIKNVYLRKAIEEEPPTVESSIGHTLPRGPARLPIIAGAEQY